MARELLLHQYLGQPVTVTTGTMTQFVGKIIGFGTTQEGGLALPRQLVHVEDQNGETGWFEIEELSLNGGPLTVKKPINKALDDLEKYCQDQAVAAERRRRVSTTSGQIRAALGGRRLAYAEVVEQIRSLRIAYIKE